MAKVVPIEEGKKNKSNLLQMRISLNESSPEIWRRFLVEDTITVYALHNVIQIVMNWTNAHLHLFEINGKKYSLPEYFEDSGETFLDEQDIKLSDLNFSEGDSFSYVYDMGDNWEHTVKVEKISKPDPEKEYPLCIEGEMACPIEDCGGLDGYYKMIEIIDDPDHDEHEDYLDWLGEDFEADFFDLEDVNHFLEEVRDIPDYDLYEYYEQFDDDLDI